MIRLPSPFRTHPTKRLSKRFILALPISMFVVLHAFTVIPSLDINNQLNTPIRTQHFASQSPQALFDAFPDSDPEDPETLAHRPYSSPTSIPLAGPFDDQQLGYYASREWMQHWIEDQGALRPDQWEAMRLDLNTTLPLRFDHIYTWVNGSDPRLLPMRKYYQEQSPVYRLYAEKTQSARGFRLRQKDAKHADRKDSIANRFRDLDELRYSVRSVAMYGMSFLRRIHIFATNVAQGLEDEYQHSTSSYHEQDYTAMSLTTGQVPEWVNPQALTNPRGVRISHHASVFENIDYLPTFNSLAIESQLYRLTDTSDIFVYLNDDTFYNRPLASTDIWTPLYGFVFHFESSLAVTPYQPHPYEDNSKSPDEWLSELDGEWNSLHYSNHLLSKQFGARPRAYVAHIPHLLSKSILHEMATIWPDKFLQTSLHRFRGEGQGQDIHTTFMMAHYVVERLRETQLRSFWDHVLDANHDGFLDWDERRWLVDKVRSWNAYQEDHVQSQQTPRPFFQNHTRPSFLDNYRTNLREAGLEWLGATTYTSSGMDGYPFMIRAVNTSSYPPAHFRLRGNGGNQDTNTYSSHEPASQRSCVLNLDVCLDPSFSDPTVDRLDPQQSATFFDRMAFQQYPCGDCLLLLLLQHADLGFDRAILPQNKSSPAYATVVRDLARYNYVVGSSMYAFVMLRDSSTTNQETLDRLTAQGGMHAFYCVNDNMPDTQETLDVSRPMFQRFLQDRFPTPSPWEI